MRSLLLDFNFFVIMCFVGLFKVIPELKKNMNDDISFQLDVIEDEAKDDWEELLHRLVEQLSSFLEFMARISGSARFRST